MLTLAVNQHGAAEGMVAVPSPPGTYYLRVLTAGPWQLSVSDLIPAVPAKAAEPAPAPATKKAP
jgi:hypothetical protein